MANVWLARDNGNWRGVYVTTRQPTWSERNLWSVSDTVFEISPTAFEKIFGWLPAPGSLHQAEIDLGVIETLRHGRE